MRDSENLALLEIKLEIELSQLFPISTNANSDIRF
jgi:hypothetical protein